MVVKNCVLTMGGEGSLFMSEKDKIVTPAFDIKVVDTTDAVMHLMQV